MTEKNLLGLWAFAAGMNVEGVLFNLALHRPVQLIINICVSALMISVWYFRK